MILINPSRLPRGVLLLYSEEASSSICVQGAFLLPPLLPSESTFAANKIDSNLLSVFPKIERGRPPSEQTFASNDAFANTVEYHTRWSGASLGAAATSNCPILPLSGTRASLSAERRSGEGQRVPWGRGVPLHAPTQTHNLRIRVGCCTFATFPWLVSQAPCLGWNDGASILSLFK